VGRPAAPAAPCFGAILEARAARGPAPGHAPSPGATDGLSAAAARGLASIDAARLRLDDLLAAARSGRTFTAQELLALQGEAYRYSQVVELGAKLVEQGAQSLKQALQAQV
jgi:hypothetical protein